VRSRPRIVVARILLPAVIPMSRAPGDEEPAATPEASEMLEEARTLLKKANALRDGRRFDEAFTSLVVLSACDSQEGRGP
jgi:hypothetical protein